MQFDRSFFLAPLHHIFKKYNVSRDMYVLGVENGGEENEEEEEKTHSVHQYVCVRVYGWRNVFGGQDGRVLTTGSPESKSLKPSSNLQRISLALSSIYKLKGVCCCTTGSFIIV